MDGNGEIAQARRQTKPVRRAAAPASRLPPHSEEAEKGLLASMMISRETLGESLDRVTAEHFFLPNHQQIFVALGSFYRQGKPVDLITFTDALRDGLRIRRDPEDPGYQIKLDELGGAGYITELWDFVPTAANARYYLDIVREKFQARQIIDKCTELVRYAYDETAVIGEILDQTQAALIEIIIESERAETFRHVAEGVQAARAQLTYAFQHRGDEAIYGIASGIPDLDRMTGGFRDENLVIVGARPSQGKTALAMNLAANMFQTVRGPDGKSVKVKVPVGVFSMEMSYQEIVNRLFSFMTGVKLESFRFGMFSKELYRQLPSLGKDLEEAPMWIDDSPALSISSFKARARLMRTRFGVKAIVVDYLQLMRSPTKRAQEARWLEITEISGALKTTAKELKIPIVCCAQLNREAEQREFGRPKLSDLRESGSIEQDADVVLLLWRPERHVQNENDRNKLAKLLRFENDDGVDLWDETGKKAEKKEKLTKEERDQRDTRIDSYAELILAKQRNGPTGDVKLRFIPELTLFEGLTKKIFSNREDERQDYKPDDTEPEEPF